MKTIGNFLVGAVCFVLFVAADWLLDMSEFPQG